MRSDDVTNWLAQSGWSAWVRHPVAGDASARRYERLVGPRGTTAILMDAPPEACGSQARFVQLAEYLRTSGLSAPEVYDWDETLGVIILEDLGVIDFATHLRAHPTDEMVLYETAVDTLKHLRSVAPPDDLVRMTPDVGTQMTDLAFEWAAQDNSIALKGEIQSTLNTLLTEVDPAPKTLSLRDFHAENLIWRPHETGLARVGLLDFQDAFVTHDAYDLASLLRDARRDVDPACVDPLIDRMAGADDAFRMAFHVMAVQRNLRILGIFNRLARQDGKPSYLSLIPRVWRHLQADLATPYLTDLEPLVMRAFGGDTVE